MPAPAGQHVDATRVSRRLYVGSPPATGSTLYKIGFHVLVFCAQPSEYDLVYGASGQALYGRFDGLYVIGCPLDDSAERPDSASLEHACLIAREVASEIRRGGRALLTCMEGRNRSAFVAALAMHDLTGRSGADCARRIRSAREPAIDKTVLFNRWFNKALGSIPARSSRISQRVERSGDSDPGLGGGGS